MRSRVLVFLAAGLLAACQIDTSRYPESSPFRPVPVGSTLTLNQPLTIPADKLAVHLQGGRVARFADVEVLKPHCKFELRRLADRERTVNPDSFRIIKVRNQESHSVSLEGFQTAGLRLGGRLRADGADSSPSMVAFVTYLDLQSVEQPEVFRLSCGHVDDPGSHYLSIEQIRKVLGDVFTLRTAEAGK